MTVRTRFAPSPTGFLHIGGARTALYNYLFAQRHGGEFVLRVEDTDAARSTNDSMEIILDGMRWLGLEWDEGPDNGGPFGPYRQSERTEIYESYFQKLLDAGQVYEDEDAWRFRVPDQEMIVEDLVCSHIRVNLKEQGSRRYDEATKQEVEANPDLVIRRPDGSFIFHFVNVVDDIEMGITHVIRGEDHLYNTPKHLALFQAFGAQPPEFAHIPLNLNPSGTKMSKRDEGALIHEYRDAGFLPEAVNNYMALLGWSSKDEEEIFTMAELIERFDLDGVNSSNSKFDYQKCLWVNGEHLRRLTAAQLLDLSAPFLQAADIDPAHSRVPECLELARERVQKLSDIPKVIETAFIGTRVTYDEASLAKVTGRDNIATLVTAMTDALEKAESWDPTSIKEAIKEAAADQGAKMGALMLPCRVAIMGSTEGVDLVPMLDIIGKEFVVGRLRNFIAQYLS